MTGLIDHAEQLTKSAPGIYHSLTEARVEVALIERRRIDGVEKLSECCDSDFDDLRCCGTASPADTRGSGSACSATTARSTEQRATKAYERCRQLSSGRRGRAQARPNSLLWRARHYRTGGVDGSDAHIAFKCGLPCRCEIAYVSGGSVGARVRDLDGRIADGKVLANDRLACTRANQNPGGIACGLILFDGVAACGADHSNPEVVGRIGVAIAMRVI